MVSLPLLTPTGRPTIISLSLAASDGALPARDPVDFLHCLRSSFDARIIGRIHESQSVGYKQSICKQRRYSELSECHTILRIKPRD